MKRLYWTAVIFIVPSYVVVVILGSYIASPGPSSSGPAVITSAVAPLIPWLASLFVFAASLDWIIEQNARSLIAPIAEYFDVDRGCSPPEITAGWKRTNMFCAMATGTFHGRWLNIALHHWLGRCPSDVTINLGCRCPWQFEIKHRNFTQEILETLGEDQIRTGIADLDNRFVFECDNSVALREWVFRPEVQEEIISLMVVRGLTSVGTPFWSTTVPAEEPNLQACYGKYRWWNNSLITGNMPGVLEDLAALANSLETLAATHPETLAS